MSAFPISAGEATGAGANSAISRFSEMSSEDFIKVIFTELSNQDPFQPNDSAALLEQLNSIRSIESDVQLTNQLKSIVTQNQLASAGTLIGKAVQGLNDNAERVTGNVMSVVREGDEVGVILDSGWRVGMDNIELIVDPSYVVG